MSDKLTDGNWKEMFEGQTEKMRRLAEDNERLKKALDDISRGAMGPMDYCAICERAIKALEGKDVTG